MYLYDTLTLIGTSCEINLFLWDDIAFSYFPRGKKTNDMPAVINVVGPQRAKMIIVSGDKLLFHTCRYYWNGLPLASADKEQIILIDADGVHRLAALVN